MAVVEMAVDDMAVEMTAKEMARHRKINFSVVVWSLFRFNFSLPKNFQKKKSRQFFLLEKSRFREKVQTNRLGGGAISRKPITKKGQKDPIRCLSWQVQSELKEARLAEIVILMVPVGLLLGAAFLFSKNY